MVSPYDGDSEKIKLLREKCNYDLLKSEEEYVNMLEVIVVNVFKPLHQNSERLGLKQQHVQYVFLFLEHMLQFHLNFLSVIRDALNIVPDFYKYSNFVQMYDDYLGKFDNVLQVFAEWKSMEFRSFVNMRLENEKVKKCIEAPMLWMLPWYLYHPFERLKIYYKFLRDLSSLTKEGDEDRKFLDDSLVKFKKVYQKIKQNEKRLRTKTKLLEVQLQIHGDYKTIVKDDRYFIMCKPCQMRRKVLHKKYKGITIYLFSDLFLWVSVRGKYKGGYSLYNNELQIDKSGKLGDAEFSIGLVTEKNKRLVVCANDEQRDSVMARITEAQRKCLDRTKNATPEQKETFNHLAKKETHSGPEISQSSAGTFDAREPSVSMSQSEIEDRTTSKQLHVQTGKVESFAMHDLTKNGMTPSGIHIDPIATPSTLMKPGDMSATANYEDTLSPPPPNFRISANKDIKAETESDEIKIVEESTTSMVSLSNGNQDKRKDNKGRHRPFSQSTREGNKKRNGNGNEVKRLDDLKVDNEHKSETVSDKITNNNNQVSFGQMNKSTNERTETMTDIKVNTNNTVTDRSEINNSISEGKSVAELKQTVQQLQEQLDKKEARIKTLESSNQSIRNTLLITKNQYFKLQEDYNALQKRVQHSRNHSFGLAPGNLASFGPSNLQTDRLPPTQQSWAYQRTTRNSAPLQRSQTQTGFSLLKE